MRGAIGWFARNPVAANLLMVGIVLAGILGFLAMEREAFPQVKPYEARIEVVWPGAAPQEIEEQIIARIEDQLEDLDQLNQACAAGKTPKLARRDALERLSHESPFVGRDEELGRLRPLAPVRAQRGLREMLPGCDDDAPVADAGPDQNVTENDVVTLDASGSSDIDSGSLTYSWTQTGGPAVTLDDANAASPTFTAPEGLANSDITFELQVSDGTNTSSDTVTITVNADNDAPSSEAGPNQTVDEGDVVTLSGSGTDPEGEGLTYTWVQTGGPAVTQPIDPYDELASMFLTEEAGGTATRTAPPPPRSSWRPVPRSCPMPRRCLARPNSS
mgnify:CR=1 FL=1